MPELQKAVFVSYASQDAEAARRICEALRAAGIEVWFDQSELRGGDSWDRQIRKQIHDCALFIPIISANSQARLEGYFRLEWRLAVERTHLMADRKTFLFPVVIDGTRDHDAEVPEAFRAVQWTRLPDGETPLGLSERVRGLLSPESAHRTTHPEWASSGVEGTVPAFKKPVRRSWFSRFALLVMAAALVITVGYVTVDRLWLPKHADTGTVPGVTAHLAARAQSAIREKSIAVLPFVDVSEKKDQEYFADGIAAEVIDQLAKIPGLKVIGRTSSFQFKGKSRDLRAIGNTLGAAYLVEGTVRKSGDRIRVTAELIDAYDGSQHWSSTYDKKSSDVTEVQDAIGVNLARAMQLTVSSDFSSRAATASPEAYDAYLRGLHAFDQLSQEGALQAIADFQRALDLDPAFAGAALGLAQAYRLSGEDGWMIPTRTAFENARAAANLAVRLDPKLGAAHAVLADVHIIYDWDWDGADREIDQALKLGSRIEAMQAAARLAAVRGQWDKATQFVERGLAADPLNADLILILAWSVDLRSGQYGKAESMTRRALEISPNIGSGRWFLGLTLLLQNRFDDALVVFKQETTYDGQLEGTAMVFHAKSKKVESDAAIRRAIAENAEGWPSAIARTYAYRRERDQAMIWLERAYSVKDEDLYLIKRDPLMKNLEGDPRYQAFLRKMNFPE